jgi:Holliday junction resolvase RusA-like endonuclease
VSLLASVRVNGIPGPKGSLSPFCPTCARKSLPQRVVVKEQSDVGVAFRKVVAKAVRQSRPAVFAPPHDGPIRTSFTFFVPRRRVVKAGVSQDEWVPSHSGPYPTFHNSGDIEKHIRTVHDALMDARLILDDSQVWKTTAEKVWADETHLPGVILEVWTA